VNNNIESEEFNEIKELQYNFLSTVEQDENHNSNTANNEKLSYIIQNSDNKYIAVTNGYKSSEFNYIEDITVSPINENIAFETIDAE